MGGGAHVNHQEPGGSGLAAGLHPKAPQLLPGLGPGPGGGRDGSGHQPRTLVVSWQGGLDGRTHLFHVSSRAESHGPPPLALGRFPCF